MTNPGGPKEGWQSAKINNDIATAHRLILEAADGPAMALLKGKASRGALRQANSKLRMAISLLEEVLND